MQGEGPWKLQSLGSMDIIMWPRLTLQSFLGTILIHLLQSFVHSSSCHGSMHSKTLQWLNQQTLIKPMFMSSIGPRSQEDKSKEETSRPSGNSHHRRERPADTGTLQYDREWQSKSESGRKGTNSPIPGYELLVGRSPPVLISVPTPPGPRPASSDAQEMC